MMKLHPLFGFIVMLFVATMACQVLGDSAEPTAAATVQPTPTLAPTATVNPDLMPSPTTVDANETTPDSSGQDSLNNEDSSPAADDPGSNSSDGEGNNGEEGSGTGDSPGGDAAGGGDSSASPIAAACPASGQNLLLNPSFEGEYKPFGAIKEVNHAANWFPWWQDGGGNFRPEYKPAELAIAPNRIHSGERAQQYFKSFGQFKAGLYQSVLNVTPGSRLQFSVHGQAWSCEDFSTCPNGTSVNPADMLMRVGIDPTGDTDWSADSIIWSAYTNPLDNWQVLCVEGVADRDIVTVFLWASPNGPRQNQDVYWDDASLVVLP